MLKSFRNKRLIDWKKFILLAGLGLTTVITSELSPGTVKVSEARTQVATGGWQGASFPVENFQTYTSPYGYRGREFHHGLDMAAPEGSYIRNWWSGVVVEVSDEGNCGTAVMVQSGQWTHIYCHLSGYVEQTKDGRYLIDRAGGVKIWQGQPIPAGARIGRVGMTGRTTGPHLHWGLKYGNQWVDPALVLRAMYAQQKGQSISSRP